MNRTISATEARIHFGEMMQRVVEAEEVVVVEREGRPKVVILSVAHYERLLAGQGTADDWQGWVAQARAQVAQDLVGKPLPPPEVVLREMEG